jgi:hypothetical protein
MHIPISHHAEAVAPEKLRATQARRNKLIAAFQKATKKAEDKKEKSVQEKQESDDKRERASSIDEVREKSVRFLTSSERNAQDMLPRRIPSPTPKDDAQDEKANADGGSSKRRPSAFEYIGTSQEQGDKADEE